MHSGFQRLVLLLPTAAVLMNGAILTADYRFNGNLNDSLSGGTALDDHGGTTGAGFYAFGPGQGLSVNNTILVDGGAYTLALRFEFDTTSGGWRKVVDFKDRTSDCGQYVNTNLNFYCVGAGGSVLSNNVTYDVVLTRDGSGTYSAYLDGVLQWSGAATGITTVFTHTKMYFFMDDFGTEHSGGTVERIMMWDGALTAVEVGQLNLTVESGTVPEPSTFALGGIALAGLGLLRHRLRS